MARAKSIGASLKGAHQVITPDAALSPRQQHVRDTVDTDERKRQAKKRRAKQAQAARARRFA